MYRQRADDKRPSANWKKAPIAQTDRDHQLTFLRTKSVFRFDCPRRRDALECDGMRRGSLPWGLPFAAGLMAAAATGCGSSDQPACSPPSIDGVPFTATGTGTLNGNGTLPGRAPDGLDLQLMVDAGGFSLGYCAPTCWSRTSPAGKASRTRSGSSSRELTPWCSMSGSEQRIDRSRIRRQGDAELHHRRRSDFEFRQHVRVSAAAQRGWPASSASMRVRSTP